MTILQKHMNALSIKNENVFIKLNHIAFLNMELMIRTLRYIAKKAISSQKKYYADFIKIINVCIKTLNIANISMEKMIMTSHIFKMISKNLKLLIFHSKIKKLTQSKYKMTNCNRYNNV